jgi:hypothetical protein
MTAVFVSAILCATLAFADQPADRTAIEKVINSLKTANPVSALFTADAESDLVQLNASQSAMSDAAKQPWSEAMPPALVIDSIRFVTTDVAIVNAANLQVTSTLARRAPVLFVMKREGTAWRIATLRMLTASPRF